MIKGAEDTVGWAVTVLQPQHISESMLRKYARTFESRICLASH